MNAPVATVESLGLRFGARVLWDDLSFELAPGELLAVLGPNAAVALLIAPGPALNTLSDPAAPPAGCSKVNQQVGTRNTASLNPANFLECGNDTGTASYAIPGPSEWTNDRVLAITAAEWAQAIAGSVADRLQRQVAPALEDWRLNISPGWGASFLPYASGFSDPTTNPAFAILRRPPPPALYWKAVRGIVSRREAREAEGSRPG